ncbi:nicotinamide-nucleotide amidase [Alkalibacillus flavidus]|uniref:Putative competence-damage inducible protein n=1 Tax=Alkalibacillus flavidus TaxID=546021 RepID=A0ABV2KRJ1_9BACI
MTTRCEIISVGTELLLGQIVDTNATWLSEQLNNIGINVYYHQTVGDNHERLQAVFERAQSRSNVIVVTGGLGPTEDDLTREVAAELFDTTLEIDAASMAKIEHFYQEKNIEMTENNRKQALAFRGGEVLANPIGMAPGLTYHHEGTLWIFLPGVPKEMKQLTTDLVIPYLHKQQLSAGRLFYRTLYFQGIGESALETELLDLMQAQTNPTIALLAGDGYVTLRLAAKSVDETESHHLFDQIEQVISSRVGSFIVDQPKTIVERVVSQFKHHRLTLASCESLTGGLFSSTLISYEGVSSFYSGSLVTYNNEAKREIAGVDDTILERDGAVSEACAKAMATGAAQKMNADVAISFTGVAGPDNQGHIPAGTVYIGLFHKGQTTCYSYQFPGGRDDVRQAAVERGFKVLHHELRNE